MESLSGHELTTVFLALAIILGAARVLGELARHFHQPAVLGEILAGIILGPTLLGRLSPGLQQSLFPSAGGVSLVLSGISSLAVVLFLLVAGMEVDLRAALRQGRATVGIAVLGLAVPFALTWVVASAAPSLFMRDAGEVFPVFLATALSISALPVVAKILKDLNLIKTDLGALIVSAATINDLGGWMLFAVVLGLAGSSAATGFSAGFPIWAVIVMTLVFVSFMLTVGRWLIHQVMPFMQAHASWPAGVLSLSLSGAFACAALTEHIGLHAIFGAFIFGVAFGDTPRLRERVRETLDQFISFIFAPLFFASIGLQMDFAAHFDLLVVSMVLVLAVVGKVAGCYLGGLLGGLGRRQSLAVGFAENARGAMEIILGLIALRAGIIDERLFVALVVMALVTSMSAGWLMIVSLNRPKPVSFVDLLSSRGFVTELASASNVEAIGELSQVAAGVTGLDAALIRDRVWEREQLIPTGLPGKVAIPHARIDGLSRPCLVLGRSEGGVDFDAPDGHAARLVFLILTPGDDTRSQLEIISGIAREFSRPGRAEQLARNRSFTDLLAALKVQD